MVNSTTSIFNPSMDSTTIFKNAIFFGEKINKWIVAQLDKIVPLTNTQNNILLYTIYLIMLYVVVKAAERMKPAIRFAIIGLIIWLVIGFFNF